MSTNGYHNGLTDILDYKMDYLWSPTEGKQFHLFLALQHTTAGLLQYGGGSYQSGLGGRLSKSVVSPLRLSPPLKLHAFRMKR